MSQYVNLAHPSFVENIMKTSKQLDSKISSISLSPRPPKYRPSTEQCDTYKSTIQNLLHGFM